MTISDGRPWIRHHLLSVLRGALGLVAAVGLGGVACPAANAQCAFGTGSWHVGVGQEAAGPLGTVTTAMGWDPDGNGPEPVVLVVAGFFSVVGTSHSNNIAIWDGTSWTPLGAGFNGGVHALAVYNGALYAGGNFTASGGTLCNRVARWTGSAWAPLGAGVEGFINAMAVYSGRLYVGGVITQAGGVAVNGIASWDGGLWRVVGVGGANGGGGIDSGSISAMMVFNDTLVIGGTFSSALGVPGTRALAKWNGTTWSSMGTVVDGSFAMVNAMALWSSSVQFNTYTLYVGGSFDSIGGVSASNVAMYPVEGITAGPWSQVGSGLSRPVWEMLVQSSGPTLHSVYASAQQGSSGSTFPGGIYRYSSGVWNQFAPEQATCLALYNGLIAGVKGISKHNGTQWTALSDGLNGPITSMHSYNGELVAFGDFTIADQQNVGGVARLDATGWNPFLGPVVSAAPAGPLNQVNDSTIFNGQFFVAGRLRDASNNESYRVYRWNGLSWVFTLQAATSQSPRFWILNSSLYLTVDTVVFRWNGVTWSQMGTAMPGFAQVRGALWWNGQLHAYGDDLYRLDGASWTLVGTNPSWMLTDGVVWNGRVLMVTADQGPSTIVELIGDQLVTLVNNFSAKEFVIHNGRLFSVAGGGIMEFDGSDWSFIASAVGAINGLGILNDSLIAWGGMSMINTTVSPMFARLICCPADATGDGQVSVSDLLLVINGWGACAGCPATVCDADVAPLPDGDCSVSVNDLLAVINAWGACP